MQTVWNQSVSLPSFPPLKKDIKTGVLVIGGGITGILCAYMLKQIGVPCVLVEADRLCGGVTGCTTAKITAQHGLIYHQLIRRFGEGKAKLYLEANQAALDRYRALARDIDCGFEEQSACVYTREPKGKKKIEQELAALRCLGYPAVSVPRTPLPFPTVDAVSFPDQAQFHPLKFIAGLLDGLDGLTIYEHTTVRELMDRTAVTDGGRIRAEAIIVATHFPFLNKHGSYFLKLYQHRSYVIALEHAADVHGMYVDESERGLSFRSFGDLLLLTGGGHRTGKQGGGWKELRDFAKVHYPQAREVRHWATQDCMSLDGVPYIGQYSRRTPGLYVATGFNKWGMTSAMVAALMLSDRIAGHRSPYESVFSPSRSILRPQLAVNAAGAVLNLLTPTAPRCPHLGCALKWNPQEHTWDCPCHGSRFTEDGKLLDNPATGDLKRRGSR